MPNPPSHPPFNRTCIYTILPPLFFNFSCLSPPGKVIKIYFLRFEKGSGWDLTMIDNYSYWNSFSKFIKMKIFFNFLQKFVQKLTWMLWKQFCLGNSLPAYIREKADFSQEKPQQLLSVEANFEGCLMVDDYMTLILLLYCLKRWELGERWKLNHKGSSKVLAASYFD